MEFQHHRLIGDEYVGSHLVLRVDSAKEITLRFPRISVKYRKCTSIRLEYLLFKFEYNEKFWSFPKMTRMSFLKKADFDAGLLYLDGKSISNIVESAPNLQSVRFGEVNEAQEAITCLRTLRNLQHLCLCFGPEQSTKKIDFYNIRSVEVTELKPGIEVTVELSEIFVLEFQKFRKVQHICVLRKDYNNLEFTFDNYEKPRE